MTIPTVTVLPKPETVLDVDLSAEVPCEGHDGPAVGRWVNRPCGCAWDICEKHYQEQVDILASLGRFRFCNRCNARLTDFEWRRL